jgi:cupin 2 domain-containing protein
MIRKGNIFEKLPKDPQFSEVFDELIRTKELRLVRIVSHGQITPSGEWYDQEDDEWVILLTGRATLSTDRGEIFELLPGDHLFIPAHCRHRVDKTTADPPCVWLALHGKL